MIDASAPIAELDGRSADLSALAEAGEPAILRGLVQDWPLMEASARSARDAAAAIAQYDSGKPASVSVAHASSGGKFFYRDDMNGFNFEMVERPVGDVARQLVRQMEGGEALSIYAGSVDTAEHLPGFDAAHPLPTGFEDAQKGSRIWIGSATRIATHFDMSPNIAVCVTGPRTFTLFPPEATPDLYVGPLHMTPAGPPVSMVDPVEPDLARYPRFEEAWKLARRAVIEPGDAIYIPAMWWHHVRADGPFNILVNYWHQRAEHGNPFVGFVHAMWAIRDLPEPHREAWRPWFEHFVFGDEAGSAGDHIPDHVRLINGAARPERDDAMRMFIMRMLSSKTN